MDSTQGKWLKIFYPDDECLPNEEGIDLQEKHCFSGDSIWLKVFCPEERCKFTAPSELP